MLAGVVKTPNRLVAEKVPDPSIGDYDALVEIVACSFCNGTDTKLIEGKFPRINQYPFILGHESVGKVLEVGGRVMNYHKGDWVLRPQAVYTENFVGGLASFWGGFAQLGVITDYVTQSEEKPNSRPLSPFYRMQQVLPKDVDPVKATTYITLKETLSWLRKVGLKGGQSILVMGSGPVGLSFASCAKILGAYPVIMTGLRDERLSLAYEFGVDYTVNVTKEDLVGKVKKVTRGEGVDLAIEAVGKYSLINEAAKAIAHEGKIGLYGIQHSNEDPILDLHLLNTPQDWTLRFTSPDEPSAHFEVLNLVKHGSLKPEKLISHIYSLEKISMGFEAIKRKEALKVVITMR